MTPTTYTDYISSEELAEHRKALDETWDKLMEVRKDMNPGDRVAVLWPDELITVQIMDNGGRLVDVYRHTGEEVEMFIERHPAIAAFLVARLAYVPKALYKFFAGRSINELRY